MIVLDILTVSPWVETRSEDLRRVPENPHFLQHVNLRGPERREIHPKLHYEVVRRSAVLLKMSRVTNLLLRHRRPVTYYFSKDSCS